MVPEKKVLLKELTREEKIDGYPTCDGLRRLVEKYVGPIMSKSIEVPHFDTGSPKPTAVVQIDVSVLSKDEEGKEYYLLHSDVADCGMYNTDPPFDNYPTATAATRAEGRIYRKLLGLSGVVSYEEVGLFNKTKKGGGGKQEKVVIDKDTPITNPQKKAIEILSRRLNTTIEEIEREYQRPIDTLSEKEGADIIRQLNGRINKA